MRGKSPPTRSWSASISSAVCRGGARVRARP